MKQSSLLNNPDLLDGRRCDGAESRLVLIFDDIPTHLKMRSFLEVLVELDELSGTLLHGAGRYVDQ